MRTFLVLLTLAAALRAQGKFDTALQNVDRRTSYKLVALARRAEEAELFKTARGAYRRILELYPDHKEARTKLGFQRRRGQWRRTAQARADVLKRADKDEVLSKQYGREVDLLEEEHIRELVRVCAKYGAPEQKRRVLLPLLDRMPRRPDLHETLGHRKVGKSYVRPGLMELVKRMPARLSKWRNCADLPVAPAETERRLAVPGLEEGLALWRLDQRDVASTVSKEASGLGAASAVARTQRFLRLLLGEEAKRWDPSPVVFLDDPSYRKMIAKLHPEPKELALYSKFGNYDHKDFLAIQSWSAADVRDRYGHSAGYWTMYQLAVPDRRAYAWLVEGFGYLVSFELFGTGYISFVSLEESAKKTTFTRPKPEPTRAAALQWLKEQMVAGHAYPLRDVCARSLNNLDFCASMEAYTFVRFLFLYDPEAARHLPGALRVQTEGPQVERLDRALKDLFGKRLDELAPLWRAFVLEIEGP